jgi:hypothetical protein
MYIITNLSFHLSVCPSVCLSICLPVYLPFWTFIVCLFVHLSNSLPFHLFPYPFYQAIDMYSLSLSPCFLSTSPLYSSFYHLCAACSFFCPSICLSVHLSVLPSICVFARLSIHPLVFAKEKKFLWELKEFHVVSSKNIWSKYIWSTHLNK